MIRRILTGAVVGLGALCAGPAAVLAHPGFLQAVPAPGLVSPKPPATVDIVVTEPLVPQGSRATITGPKGAVVDIDSATSAKDRSRLSVKPREQLAPGVYRVRWHVLGEDGHVVSGDYSFGVAKPDGSPPPGAEKLTAEGGRGGEATEGEGPVGVISRWLGIVAASLLFAGGLLVLLLRRRGPADAADGSKAFLEAAPIAWLVAAFAAIEGVIVGATTGADGGFDLGLLTGSATGQAELARALVVLIAGLAATFARPLRAKLALAIAGGALVLLSYAISGHVVSDPSVLAVLDQAVHVLTAGLWLGGVIALVLVTRRGGVDLLRAARTFGPIAGAALAVAIVTGVLAAVREVDHWYFFRWSDYGQVLIAKSLLVLLVAVIGGYAAWRSRRPDSPGPRPRLLGVETFGVLAIVVLAATLAGLAPGRGQALPAQRGALFVGPALGTAVVKGGSAALTLAPARKGSNVVSVELPGRKQPAAVSVRLTPPDDGPAIELDLKRTRGSKAWSAPVVLPADGTWFGYVSVDGDDSTAPVQLRTGVPSTPGADPVEVLTTADLSGPNAARCRSHVQGLELALARINAEGGVDGGRKLASLVLDDGGDAARARSNASAAIKSAEPIALAAPCGDGGDASAAVAADAGLPSILGDPAVAPTRGRNSFRLAADPYAEGLAWAQSLATVVQTAGPGASNTIRVVIPRDAQGRRRLAGLRAGLKQLPGVKLALLEPGSLADRGTLVDLLDRTKTLTLFVDGSAAGGVDAEALAALSRTPVGTAPPPVVLSGRVLSEQLLLDSGPIGRVGVLQGNTEVSTKTRDGLLYGQAVPLLYPGDRASLQGLRGYVSGLALRDGVRNGIESGQIANALTKPRVFTDALLAPWSPRQPGAGSPSLVNISPQFISPTLRPSSQGGDRYSGAYFPDGAWLQNTPQAIGVTRDTPAPLLP